MIKRAINFIRLTAELNKVRITIAVTLTTLAGYTMAAGAIKFDLIYCLTGIFILACGSAAFNQYQERNIDKLMSRTKSRPLPSGRIKPAYALIISFSEIAAGSFILYIGNGTESALLGFSAFIWYNIIYTPLKRITPFAVIPGSVIGAIPPVVGWVSGGGSLNDLALVLTAFFFFISQIPHFWLLLLKYGDDYKSAGFPVLSEILTIKQIKRVTFVWIVAASVNIILLSVSGIIENIFFRVFTIITAVWLIFVFSDLQKKSADKINPIKYFMKLNIFFLLIILSMILDSLLN